MRFRKLQEHAKEAVGVYRLVPAFYMGKHSQCVCVCVCVCVYVCVCV